MESISGRALAHSQGKRKSCPRKAMTLYIADNLLLDIQPGYAGWNARS
jgi:hypothetical protein